MAATARADEPATDLTNVKDITEVSLDQLLKADTDVATKIPQTFRETPGVITVITREEIMDSGARNLEDVLQLVPGFSLAVDVEGVTDVGVRGNWGHEGKVLLLVDGQPMNETLFSDNVLGNHYPIDAIERIEIIRGPGSVTYGGFAELAVINVITRGADELEGGAVYFEGGFMAHTVGLANLSLAVGQTAGKLKLSGSLLLGEGHRSDQPFTDFYGSSYSLSGHSMNPAFIDIGLKYDALSARFIYDHYRNDEGDALSQNEAMVEKQVFAGYYAELKYDAKLSEELTVTPKLQYQNQTPWQVLDQASAVFYDKSAQRATVGALATYKAAKGLDLLGGVETYWDHAALNQPAVDGTSQIQFGMADDVTYYNEAVYAQALYQGSLANVTVGARYEHHSAYGNSFVPRVAVTKVFEPFHIKLLYSEAFRAPGFEDINLAANGTIDPEHTRVGEVELGYAIDAHNFVTVNGFYTRISNPIVYFVTSPTVQGYENFDHTSTAGVEADYKTRYAWGYFDVNYSFYRAMANTVPLYAVMGHDDLLRGMPQHKITAHGAYKLWKELRVAPSLIAFTGAYGALLPGDGMGTGTLGQADATVLVNLFLTYRDLGVKGTELGLGAWNLFDSKFLYLQPYDAGHAPMQGATRSLILRVGYTKPF